MPALLAAVVAAEIYRLFYIVTVMPSMGLYIILRRFGTDDAFGWTAGVVVRRPLLNATADALQMFLQRKWRPRSGGIWSSSTKAVGSTWPGAFHGPPARPPQKKESGGGRVGGVVG